MGLLAKDTVPLHASCHDVAWLLRHFAHLDAIWADPVIESTAREPCLDAGRVALYVRVRHSLVAEVNAPLQPSQAKPDLLHMQNSPVCMRVQAKPGLPGAGVL